MARPIDSPFKTQGYEIDEPNLSYAIEKVVSNLKKRMSKDPFFRNNFRLERTPNLMFEDMKSYLQLRGEKEGTNYADIMDNTVLEKSIKPDGGIIWLVDNRYLDVKYPILISEVKHQGTNGKRLAKGCKKQAMGNAIEKLGKYTSMMQSLYVHDSIAPFVVFCSGFDFRDCDADSDSSMKGKLVSMNDGFMPVNVVYTSANSPAGRSPSTILAREEKFSMKEMMAVLEEVAIDSLEYFKTIADDIAA